MRQYLYAASCKKYTKLGCRHMTSWLPTRRLSSRLIGRVTYLSYFTVIILRNFEPTWIAPQQVQQVQQVNNDVPLLLSSPYVPTAKPRRFLVKLHGRIPCRTCTEPYLLLNVISHFQPFCWFSFFLRPIFLFGLNILGLQIIEPIW